MSAKRRSRLSLRAREAINGHLFTLPFVIGFIMMFLYPFIQSMLFSFSKLEISSQGYTLTWIGLENYYNALFVNAEYPQLLVETALQMLRNVPLILVFSFFASILLNQQFKGRLFARVVFFLPVILSADIILRMESADYISAFLDSALAEEAAAQGTLGTIFSRGQLVSLLMYLKLPQGLVTYIVTGSEQVANIIRSSGVQILIFLAGLQSISPSLFEVAKIEGATGWECFWMITFPMLSPLIVTNIVYSIIDFFTVPSNPLVDFIKDNMFGGAGYGVAMAMSWLYFAFIALFLLLTAGLISRRVVYMD
ncbi:MAG: sugar ABC transporter permease [Limnochordia bacterium]|jgi:ABC-type sugar transport system permease subunit|nr:sugar ABC transporter permease [Bacillota bacterium]NLH30484.1 sugar ABC transporter permease [Bacillota bacterium]